MVSVRETERVFRSVLCADETHDAGDDIPQPDYFANLNLDQVESAVSAGRDDYRLGAFFRTPLRDVDALRYRQAVFLDIDGRPVRALLSAFGEQLAAMRKMAATAAKLHDVQPKRRWFLNAVDAYCEAVLHLAAGLADCELHSDGLLGLRDFVEHYVRGSRFGAVREQSTALLRELGEVRYDLLTRGTKLTVAPYDEEPDYSAEVLASFERFRQGDVKDHRGKITPDNRLNHVEVAVLDMVAQLYPQLFGRLGEFCARHEKFVDRTVSRADRELQFYLGYLDFTDRLRRAGLRVSYPEISTTCKAIAAADTFDIALAAKLVGDGATVVTNDFHLDGAERVLVVSGPNQGGKTTLARTVGQLCHVAALGCPVPGTRTRLFLPDAILTHFEREEDIETLAGKLEEELYRMHAIFDTATGDSVIILNEIFNSTTVQDAAELSQRMLSRISDLDALCVCVTFIDELASLNEKTVSMVSTVAEHDPAVRTYRLVRKPADGRAYALAIAQKYRLTYDALKERLA